MKYRFSWDVDIRSAAQEIHLVLWNPKFHCRSKKKSSSSAFQSRESETRSLTEETNITAVVWDVTSSSLVASYSVSNESAAVQEKVGLAKNQEDWP